MTIYNLIRHCSIEYFSVYDSVTGLFIDDFRNSFDDDSFNMLLDRFSTYPIAVWSIELDGLSCMVCKIYLPWEVEK